MTPLRLLCASLLVTSCSALGVPVATTPAEPVTEPAADPVQEDEPAPRVEPPPGADGTFTRLAVDALRTPTGVVVAVLDHTPHGYLVRAPCGDTAVVASGGAISGITVVLDPGHGGPVDTGAVGPNGLAESELNLRVARAAERELRERGISVVLTRTADYATPLAVRAGLADHLGAEVLVSIHHNAPTPSLSSVPGTEVYVQSDSDDSRRLGGLVWQSVVDALSGFDAVDWGRASNAGVLHVLNTRGIDAYGMVRGPETVSVLAELGYLSNPSEAALFATTAYVATVSVALADAIDNYLHTDSPGAGFIAEARVFNPRPGVSADLCVNPPLG